MPTSAQLAGPAGAYAAASAAKDYAGMLQVAIDLAGRDEIVLPHPDRPDLLCRCRSSLRDGMDNVLFFTDDEGGNRWLLVQNMDFIQAMMTETAQHFVTRQEESPLGKIAARWRGGEFDRFWRMRHRFGGLALHSARPFHFFYDQMVHLPDVLAALPAERRVVHVDEGAFLSPDRVLDIAAAPIRDDRYYVLPNVAAGLGRRNWDREDYFDAANEMESSIAAAIPAQPPEAEADLVLWTGITGQKRSWVEQTEGNVAIIRELARHFPRLHVYIDGITAPEGRTVAVPEDEKVADRIVADVGDAARVESLVGRDYPEKIARCHAADLFIANGGSGCIVPLRICRKPGVLHSNRRLWTFRHDESPTTVVRVDLGMIQEVSDKARSGFVSYSIPWQHVYNRLVFVLGKVRGIDLPELDVPQEPGRAEKYGDRALFGQLQQMVTPEADSGDILREVAKLFEKKGDIVTALALMEQASLQKPHGPYIKRKIDQYRLRLAREGERTGEG
jgi:hypothetical protein